MSKFGLFTILVALISLMILPGIVFSSPTLDVTSFSYDPAPASPSATMNVWIQIKNNSNEAANNAFIRLDLADPETGRPNYPFSAPDQNLEKKFSLAPYQNTIIRYSISVDAQALNGDYKIEIIEAPKIEQRPGSQFDIPITIKNLGNDTAYNVLVGVLEDRTVTSTGL